MAKLIIQRMSEPDCEFNGYIIIDLPDTIVQFNLLQESNKLPRIMVLREFDPEAIRNNLNNY